jgi:DNA polymerase-3 subunit delta'
MRWPGFDERLAWLTQTSAQPAAPVTDGEEGVKSLKTTKTASQASAPQPDDLRVLLAAAGGRPADALQWARGGAFAEPARDWRALPKAMARGDVSALADWAPPMVVDALQKLCHDMWTVKLGAKPRFFSREDLPLPAHRPGSEAVLPAASPASLFALAAWSKELAVTSRTVEHPYNPGLMLEALVSRASLALNTR